MPDKHPSPSLSAYTEDKEEEVSSPEIYPEEEDDIPISHPDATHKPHTSSSSSDEEEIDAEEHDEEEVDPEEDGVAGKSTQPKKQKDEEEESD